MASRTKVMIGLGVAGGLGFAAWLASRAGASSATGPRAPRGEATVSVPMPKQRWLKVWEDKVNGEAPVSLKTKPKFKVGDVVSVAEQRETDEGKKVVAISTPRKILVRQGSVLVTGEGNAAMPVPGTAADYSYLLEEAGNPSGWLVQEKVITKA